MFDCLELLNVRNKLLVANNVNNRRWSMLNNAEERNISCYQFGVHGKHERIALVSLIMFIDIGLFGLLRQYEA